MNVVIHFFSNTLSSFSPIDVLCKSYAFGLAECMKVYMSC